MLKIIFAVIAIIFFAFIVLLPLLGFIIGFTTMITSDKGKDWEGARYIDGK